MKHISLLLLIIAFVFVASANDFKKSKIDTVINTFNKDFVYNVKKAQSTIIIDGVVEEADWLNAQRTDQFYRVLPIDTGFATQPSAILMTYDNKALYLA